jgi:hypothetical protein
VLRDPLTQRLVDLTARLEVGVEFGREAEAAAPDEVRVPISDPNHLREVVLGEHVVVIGGLLVHVLFVLRASQVAR